MIGGDIHPQPETMASPSPPTPTIAVLPLDPKKVAPHPEETIDLAAAPPIPESTTESIIAIGEVTMMEMLPVETLTHVLKLLDIPSRVKLASCNHTLQQRVYRECSEAWKEVNFIEAVA